VTGIRTTATRLLPSMLVILLMGCGEGAVTGPDPEAGRQMYRDGIRPSGEPLIALVAGDVPVLGTQFSCGSCHGRSGMGASESTYTVPPIAAQFLFVDSPQPQRPAYNTESLARVLREGVTPSGRALSADLMPRYELGDDEVASLSAYLAMLSAGNSPGVDDTTIRFATVITDDVDAGKREAVLKVLNKFAEEINRQTRMESERRDRGNTPDSKLPTAFRSWELEEWVLSGPPESWDSQLERYYEREPVFAMLSGLSTGSWQPIGQFCERREIPCLFPSTKLPHSAEAGFYTMYFSRGLELEADLIAHDLAKQPLQNVIQVYCAAAPAHAASRLSEKLAESTMNATAIEFDCNDSLPAAELAARVGSSDDTAVVYWLDHEQLAGLEDLPAADRIYLSSALLDGELPASLPSDSGPVFLVQTYLLPGKPDSAMQRFILWAKTRNVEIDEPLLQAEAFFACLMLNDAIKHIGRFYVRDYMLDMLDHAQGMTAYLPFYPRPSFGPSQRFASKGGYVVPIVNGAPVTQDAEWIVP
jgi:cytochrome c553